jgi:hypothetical protein
MKVRLRNHNIHSPFTTPCPIKRACCALSLLLLASGCALSPPQPEPPGAETGEQRVTEDTGLMAQVASMQPGESRSIDGMTVESGRSFFAASGRLCKYITRSKPNNPGTASTQLACQDEHGWIFAPDIFTSAARSGD